MLGFETLTFCADRSPADRSLNMLTVEELGWLNAYHAHVLAKSARSWRARSSPGSRRACAADRI